MLSGEMYRKKSKKSSSNIGFHVAAVRRVEPDYISLAVSFRARRQAFVVG